METDRHQWLEIAQVETTLLLVVDGLAREVTCHT
jgi:hypothetical protein